MASVRTSEGATSVLKHLAIGTGVVALAYASYRCVKWMRYERNVVRQLWWINEQLKVKEILLIDSDADWPMVISRLKADLAVFKVLGLDAEWVPGDNPVALLQLATHSGLVILLRLCHLKTIPQEFTAIMSDKGILKFGVGVLNDALKVEQHYGINVQGCVDLRHLAKRQRRVPIGKKGLSSLTQAFLGFWLVKIKSITCSNWEADPLDDKQIQYATADALAAVRIFTKILELQYGFSRINSHPEKTWQKALSLCHGITDLEYTPDVYGGRYYGIFDKVNGDGKEPENGKARSSVGRAYPTRKKPLNENCQVQGPDGQFLYVCDCKQARWYVDKGLGKQIAENPMTIQLLFEPSGRSHSDKNYYLQDKENVCVVCGSQEGQSRKIVVPHEYQKYFPPVMKKHSRHDVLPLCTTCLEKSNRHDSSLKQHYVKKCNAPFESLRYVSDQEIKSVNSAARALLKSRDKLPVKRREELEQILYSYFGVEELSEKLLRHAAEIDPKMLNLEYVPHGEKVVEYVTANEGLLEFERTWRQHFLDTMRPQFLYEGWSVEHGHKKLRELDNDVNSALSDDNYNM